MPRISRNNLQSHFLHIMVQGINKEYIFSKEQYIKLYLNLFYKYKKEYKFTLIAYCMMNNHAHFLVHTEDINEISKFMHKLNLIYSIKYNNYEHRIGVVFRNRYKSEAIYDREYLLNCIKYIHNNPVKAGIVNNCIEYKFSSYHDYVYNTGLSQSLIMNSIFGSKCNYMELFDKLHDKLFIDIKNENDINYYILERNRRIFKNV